MNGIEVISVHVPKCAGVALRQVLEAAYGSERVYRDYGDRPADPASPMNLDPEGFFERTQKSGYGFLDGKKVVHGHFNIRKYESLPARFRITFLRDPVERTISHYYFWQTWPRHGHHLHDYFLDNRLSLQEFARLPMISGFYSSVFFGGVAMEQFDFIGFHDRLERDHSRLLDLIGIDEHPIPVENANPSEAYQSERRRTLRDEGLMQSLRALLRDDVAFYERLREKWS